MKDIVYRLDRNQLSSSGASMLFDTLKVHKSTIETLWIQHNKLDDDCMKSLGEYMKVNKSIGYVRIGYNDVSDKGIDILSPYLIGNTNIKYFGLGGNKRMTDKSFETLSKIIKSSNIEGMNIKKSHLSKKNALIVLLMHNRLRCGTDKINLSGG